MRAATLPELAECGLVIEAIVEDLDVKRGLLRDLEAIVGPRCILATNTSSLSVTAMAAGLRQPERVVGMHFFNPPTRMKLVEVISGLETAPEVARIVHATSAAFAMARSAAPGCASTSNTRWPAWAATWAMPAPMAPAPMTPTTTCGPRA
jgi:3-hydroxyacyl-CoA dehydrogenase